MTNKKEVISFLKENNFSPSKKLGQNFLINNNINKRIVDSCSIKTNEYILEIGAGLGAITQFIFEKTKNLILVELDKRLSSYLKNNFKQVLIYNDDFLKFDFEQKLKDIKKIKVISNLPYSISSKIILKLLSSNLVDEIFILVQKEMAQRLLAKINSKDYNAFSVLIQMFSDIKYLFTVAPNNFIPMPKVDSWFISIKKNKKFNLDFDEINFFLKVCFSAKRKKLFNNLINTYNKKIINEAFAKLNINHDIRAEQLSLENFYQLYSYLEREKDEENKSFC